MSEARRLRVLVSTKITSVSPFCDRSIAMAEETWELGGQSQALFTARFILVLSKKSWATSCLLVLVFINFQELSSILFSDHIRALKKCKVRGIMSSYRLINCMVFNANFNIFQLYRSGQWTYPCFPEILFYQPVPRTIFFPSLGCFPI